MIFHIVPKDKGWRVNDKLADAIIFSWNILKQKITKLEKEIRRKNTLIKVLKKKIKEK